ncbi:MAG: ribose 5-phosphate isomerase B [Paludibacter sp.]
MNPYKNLRIAVCNDHAGYDLKLKIVEYLEGEGAVEVKDFGSHSTESCDYPDFAHPMAGAIKRGEYDFGVSICGTGNGISMVLNKHLGIRAALCWKPEIAALAREHNDANVLSLPARFITEEEALNIIEVFFMSKFEGGRHQRRIDKMNQL